MFTVSGNPDHYYVSDAKGRIVATCDTSDLAALVADALNEKAERA